MRSIVLVILSAAVLAGLFMLYWTIQPAGRAVVSGPAVKHVIVPPPSAEEDRLNSLSGIHPGDVVWFKEYDGNQDLTSAFSAETFVPHPDGTVHVTSPVAQFFLANHQRIEVKGIDGNVVLKDPPDLRKAGMFAPVQTVPPSRGRLNARDHSILRRSPARPDHARPHHDHQQRGLRQRDVPHLHRGFPQRERRRRSQRPGPGARDRR